MYQTHQKLKPYAKKRTLPHSCGFILDAAHRDPRRRTSKGRGEPSDGGFARFFEALRESVHGGGSRRGGDATGRQATARAGILGGRE